MSTDTQPAGPFIVVGVDGSPSSVDALRWAAKQAELTGAALRVVTAWQIPSAYGLPLGDLSGYDAEGNAGEVLKETVGAAAVSTPLTTWTVQGSSAGALVESAKGAELLVVGRRGHGELIGAILGSVSAYCVAHAPCPVVVVHHEDEKPEDGTSN